MERWKDVKGYNGLYQISSFGRVKSLGRWRGNGQCGYLQKEKILKQSFSNNGYLSITLSKDGKAKKFLSYQLVAIAFLNHTLNGYKGLLIDHIDNDKTNNNLDNLQLVTARCNLSKDRKKGASKYTGVSRYKRSVKWIARVDINSNYVYLGSFTDEIEASNMYQKALLNLDKYNGNNKDFRDFLKSL